VFVHQILGVVTSSILETLACLYCLTVSCGIDSRQSFVKLPAVQMADDQRRKR